MSKSICVTSALTCKKNFIINLFQNIVCCGITFLYYKRNRKTRLVRLWCDNALGKCEENTRETCKTRIGAPLPNYRAGYGVESNVAQRASQTVNLGRGRQEAGAESGLQRLVALFMRCPFSMLINQPKISFYNRNRNMKPIFKIARALSENDTRKVKVLSLPETIDEGPSLETSIFPVSFQVVREPLPFAYY